MDKRGKEDSRWMRWNTGNHNEFPILQKFDPMSISVAGFRAPVGGRSSSSPRSIPFKDLANGVKVFPTGYDALDLTRAIQCCKSHLEEQWLYPDHYEQLVNQLPQDAYLASYPPGPAPVQADHQGVAAIDRLTTACMAARIRSTCGRKRDSKGRLIAMNSGQSDKDREEFVFDLESNVDLEALPEKAKTLKRKHGSIMEDGFDASGDELSKSILCTGKKRLISTQISYMLRDSFNRNRARFIHARRNVFAEKIDSDSDEYQGPKKKQKALKEARRSQRNKKVVNYYY